MPTKHSELPEKAEVEAGDYVVGLSGGVNTRFPGPLGATGPQGPQGPAGADGADGADGAQGPAGADGSDGADGADGNTVLYGASDPGPGDGVDGNFYINTTSNTLFGPKAGGTWPGGTSLVGPQGPQGIQGIQGPAGNDGADGADGAVGPEGPQGPQGIQGPAGADGADGSDANVTTENVRTAGALMDDELADIAGVKSLTGSNTGDEAVFAGAGADGLVPDPTTESGQYLRDDGTWATPPGGGGGEANTTSNDGTGEGLAKTKDGVDLPFKSLVGGEGIALSSDTDEVTISAQTKAYFDRYKPAGEAIFISAIGRSLLTPWPASGLPNNLDVFDYGSDGTGSPGDWNNPAFRQLDITATAKADVQLPYTGHTLGNTSSYMHGFADRLQKWSGRPVYILMTHWSGKGLVDFFYAYRNDSGGGEGTGYTEFRTRMKEVAALGLTNFPAVPDFHVYNADELNDTYTDGQILEYISMTDAELVADGVLGENTVRVFMDPNNDHRTMQTYNQNRSAHAALDQFRSVLVPFIGRTFDRVHLSGNDQFNTGAEGAHILITPQRMIDQPPGARFRRSMGNLTFYQNYAAATAGAPSLTKQWNVDSEGATTKLRVSFLAFQYIFGVPSGDQKTYTRQWRSGWQVVITDRLTPANSGTYLLGSEGTWSDVLPAAAGRPNHMEFDATLSSSTGTWPPAPGTSCTMVVQRPNFPSGFANADIGMTETLYDTGGWRFSGKVGFKTSKPVARVSASGGVSDAGAAATGVSGQPILLDGDGNEVAVTGMPGFGHGEFTVGRAGVAAGFDVGGYLIPPASTKGILSGTIRCAGRRTDSASNPGYYCVTRNFCCNFHTEADAAANTHNTMGAAIGAVDPLPAGFTNPLRIASSAGGTGGFNARNFAFHVPDKTGETWQWQITIDFEWRSYT